MNDSTSFHFSAGFKRLLLLAAGLNSLIGLKRISESWQAPELFKRDFVQEYLMAKAIWHGVNPYLPLPELASRWLPAAVGQNALQHPTPHTPLVGLLSLPLGWVSYEMASGLWLLLELGCLAAATILLLRWWGAPVTTLRVAGLLALAVGWIPVIEELWQGQLGACLLLLLVSAWLALRKGQDVRGGALLGGLIALKMTAWPIVVFLLLRRRWQSVLAAAAVVLMAHLVASAVLGGGCVQEYYQHVGPQIASLYRTYDCSYSAWTVGVRLFAGFGYHFSAPPLWDSPTLAAVFTYAVPLAVLFLGMALALRAKHFDTSFGLLVGIGILTGPVAWSHYWLLALIPLSVIAQKLWQQGLPRKQVYLAFAIWLPSTISTGRLTDFTLWFADGVTPEGVPIVPSWAGWLTLLPGVALVALLLLLWRWERAEWLPKQTERDLAATARLVPRPII